MKGLLLTLVAASEICRVSILAPVNKVEICAGQIARFSAASTGKEVSFQWDGPNGFSSTNASISVTAIPAASGKYSAVVVDASGCVNTGTVQLIVLPVLTCYITPDPALVSPGESLEFTINPEGGSPPFTFLWWGPNGFVSTNQTAVVSTQGFYIGSVRDSKGCNNSDSVFLNIYSDPRK